MEHIFATHLEDWPALLRSLRLVGDDVRQKARKQMVAGEVTNSEVIDAVIRRLGLILLVVALAVAQDRPTFRVKVDMVVLSFTITDNKGHYVNGLKPKDFRILEDGIPQKLSTFAEGNKPPVEVAADGTFKPIRGGLPTPAGTSRKARSDAFVGTNVFVLFDTSNYMYRGFVYASDAIADFIRGLDRADSVAVYTYQPQSDARGAAEQGAQRRDLRSARTPWRATIRRSTTACC